MRIKKNINQDLFSDQYKTKFSGLKLYKIYTMLHVKNLAFI